MSLHIFVKTLNYLQLFIPSMLTKKEMAQTKLLFTAFAGKWKQTNSAVQWLVIKSV